MSWAHQPRPGRLERSPGAESNERSAIFICCALTSADRGRLQTALVTRRPGRRTTRVGETETAETGDGTVETGETGDGTIGDRRDRTRGGEEGD